MYHVNGQMVTNRGCILQINGDSIENHDQTLIS